ncbi:hypothetical protein Plhal304r1_c027g0089641 [Plasmopara halstedii]
MIYRATAGSATLGVVDLQIYLKVVGLFGKSVDTVVCTIYDCLDLCNICLQTILQDSATQPEIWWAPIGIV